MERNGRAPGAPRRELRLVAARRPAPAAGLVRFHPRLTVLTGFGDDASEWLSELLVPGRAPDTIVSLDRRQLPVDAVPAVLGQAPEPVVTAARLQQLLDDHAQGSGRDLRARAEDVGARLSEVRDRRDDIAARRARVVEKIEAAHHRREPAPEEAAFVDVFLDAEANALADELDALDQELSETRPRDAVQHDLAQWEQVLEDAQLHLSRARDTAPQVAPEVIAEATRLRNDWRYAEQAHKSSRRRRSRREAEELRAQYEAYLAQFGATCFEDLAVVGTGFGTTEADIAIREAATVVSMAEQKCAALRAELDAPSPLSLENRRAAVLSRAAALLGRTPGANASAELRAFRPESRTAVDLADGDDLAELHQELERLEHEYDATGAELQALERESGSIERARLELADRATKGLSALGPVAVEALLGRALIERRNGSVTRPLVVDDILRSLAPRSRRRAFDVLAALSRSRQVVLVSDSEEVATWATELAAEDVLVWTAEQAAEAIAI